METVIAFIIIFGALVFFHELGHFLFAKRAGILCREFAIGFGPKVFSHKRGETVYTVRLLPIGGFVRMAGEDPEMVEIKPGYRVGLMFNDKGQVNKIILNNKDKYADLRVIEVEKADIEHDLFIRGYVDGEEEELVTFPIHPQAMLVENGVETILAPYDRQFASKSLLQRTLTIFAGPLFNFILALIIFLLLAFIQGVPTNEPALGKLTPDGVAKQVGLQEGDVVLSISDTEISSWEDVVMMIRDNPGKELEFYVDRDGETKSILVTPAEETIEEGKKIGLIGVYNPIEKSPFTAIGHGFKETYMWTKEIIVILGTLVTGQFSIDMLAGPVGIYQATDTVAKSGVFYLMKWAGLLSINLGIVNLLPIPALDGGRLVFFAIEAVRGKPLDSQKEGMVHFIGFALLMLLMLVVTWNDIQRFFL